MLQMCHLENGGASLLAQDGLGRRRGVVFSTVRNRSASARMSIQAPFARLRRRGALASRPNPARDRPPM